MKATKKRTLEQIKSLKIYDTTPKAEKLDSSVVMDLVRRLPNDADLGHAVRNYYNSLENEQG